MRAKVSRPSSEVAAHIMGPRILLLLVVLALLMMGFVMIYSASSVSAIGHAETLDQADPTKNLFDQIKFAIIGIACAVVLWKFIPYRIWKGPFVWVIWGIAIVLVVTTALIGKDVNGAKRWISVAGMTLQSSEFAKIALVLMAARILSDFREGTLSVRALGVQVLVLLLLPTLFLFKMQSDLGSTLIIFVGVLAVMWIGEVPLKTILIILGIGVVFAMLSSLVGFRQDRWIFINPWNDGMGGYDKGYQLIHSFYAFSEGGILGVGLGNSREKYLYLPEGETDFIFAIIGEELGMIGAVVVIVLFLTLLYTGSRIARSVSDNFGTMLAGSCVVMITFQAFLNMGCVIGLLPTTGKPLPFVSAGGSSLIATFIMIGLVLSVSQAAGSQTSVYDRRRANLRVIRTQSDAESMSSIAKERGPAKPRRQRDSAKRNDSGGSANRRHCSSNSRSSSARRSGSGQKRR